MENKATGVQKTGEPADSLSRQIHATINPVFVTMIFFKGVRFIPERNYIVFYTVNADTVSIARIMYGARDLSHQLAETNEW